MHDLGSLRLRAQEMLLNEVDDRYVVLFCTPYRNSGFWVSVRKKMTVLQIRAEMVLNPFSQAENARQVAVLGNCAGGCSLFPLPCGTMEETVLSSKGNVNGCYFRSNALVFTEETEVNSKIVRMYKINCRPVSRRRL